MEEGLSVTSITGPGVDMMFKRALTQREPLYIAGKYTNYYRHYRNQNEDSKTKKKKEKKIDIPQDPAIPL